MLPGALSAIMRGDGGGAAVSASGDEISSAGGAGVVSDGADAVSEGGGKVSEGAGAAAGPTGTGALGAQPIAPEKNTSKNATATIFFECADHLESARLRSTCFVYFMSHLR